MSEIVENGEWIRVVTDSEHRILFGIKADGSIEWSVGVPTPIQKLINSIVVGTDGINLDGLNKIEDFLNDFSTEDSLKTLLDGKMNVEEVDSGYVDLLLDANNKIIMGVECDGGVIFGKIPSQIQKLLDAKEDKHDSGGDVDPDETKLMKVVINVMDGHDESMAFYIRTKYNIEKDIIISHHINNNNLISFENTYIGPKDLDDAVLINNNYLVSKHTDSIGPFYDATQYWHLFAAHGYLVPYIDNNIGMTSDDVGAEWKDQLERHFIIGKVDSSYIWLLPVIYKDDNNHDVRDWHSGRTSTAISSLTHISGGVYTDSITVGTNHSEQLRPIMEHSDREWFADGVEITKPGTYYCDSFKVNESQVGYDPATIRDWFDGTDGQPVLTGAEVLAKFTYSYNYYGAQCCVNTTVDVRREIQCSRYGATQQQFFFDVGDYKAMFLIPKAAARNGVEIDKPFNSPSESSRAYTFYRTADYLKDVNDPIDRQIGYLFNPTIEEYLVGMAAGLSLVSGDTVKSKRVDNLPAGDKNARYAIGSISPSNTNKFYIAAVNTAPFEENDYYFPTNYFKEINFYVSYFDPAENVGQVYWYKDGNNYVIYTHCQNIMDRVAIKVPSFMEGLKLSVVEKTDDAQLLTETIQNGKFFVNYASDEANYIVLKTN